MQDNIEKMTHSLQIEPSQSMVTAQSPEAPLGKLFMVASIATGIQFIWAMQLSLLTPYVQLLGIPHKLASLIWLCGPIAGIVVQPIAGYYSDNSASRFGHRRPYLAVGTAFIVIAIFLISFAADIGHAIGDPLGNSIKPRAIVVFVTGFCLLHIANNILQETGRPKGAFFRRSLKGLFGIVGPSRAFLGDLSCTNTSKTRTANASYAFFLSLGGILGYAAGSINNLHKMFPFTVTNACDIYCANLKCCFFLSITILIIVATLVLIFVKEELNPKIIEQTNTISNEESRTKNVPFYIGMISAMKDMPKSMWILLLVTFLNIFATFPYRMFGTDWMGREVYGGKVGEGDLYYQGVHVGSLGLMIQAIMMGVTSLAIEFLARGVGGGVDKLWGFSNFLLAICLCLLVLITKLAESSRRYTTAKDGKITPMAPEVHIKAGALALFGVMGIPQAVTNVVPYTLASLYSDISTNGQGLTVGVLNLGFVVPQLLVSLLSGPWDDLFGGGNLPSFIIGAFVAAASGVVALCLLPSPPPDITKGKSLVTEPVK